MSGTTTSSMAIPEPMQALSPEDMKGDRCPLPREPGVYAAWITSEEALEELGVEGPAPVVVYIGKAGPTSRTKGKPRTLRDRLREHVRQPGQQDCYPFFELAELLGVRRTILLPIWHRNPDKVSVSRYRSRPSPLGQLSIDQALAWQYENLVWGWVPLPADQVNQMESTLIRQHQPLLNQRGMPSGSPPPQLRRIGPYEADRARWLCVYSNLAASIRAALAPDQNGQYDLDARWWPIVSSRQETTTTFPVSDGRSVCALHWDAGLHSPDERSWREPLMDAWEDTFFSAPPDGVLPEDWEAAVIAEEVLWIAAGRCPGGVESLFATTAHESDAAWTMPTPEIVKGLLALQKKWTSWERH